MTPTPEQKTAVESEANKILISASAGSGKTTTMISRIVRILEFGKTTLDQLLVLTFTEESAKDMRKKLKQRLGNKISPVELQAAAIGTFHSFCASVVRAWFSVAEVSPTFAVMDEIESGKIKAEVFDKIVKTYYAQAKTAIDLFAATRTLDGLSGVITQITEFLETRQDPQTWLQTVALKCYDANVDQNLAIQEVMNYYRQTATWFRSRLIDLHYDAPQMHALLQIVEAVINAKCYQDFYELGKLKLPALKNDKVSPVYPEFKNLHEKFKSNVYTKIVKEFAFPAKQIEQEIVRDKKIVELLIFLVEKFDQAYTARKAELKKLDFADLEKYALKVLANAEAVASIRAKYKYIFVDEGQDTNPVQFQIIDILRGEDKFFYMVGDVKQSIYGFRGCEPEIFDQMTLQDALHFNTNFRSNGSILSFVNSVFVPLMKDYQTKHKFILREQPTTEAVKIELADNRETQMELIYRQIIQAKRPLNEIAILSERATHFESLAKYLTARGIACVIDRAGDASQEYEVAVLNNFLFAALNPTNEFAKYLTMKHLFGCTNDDLAQIKMGRKSTAEIDAVLQRYQTLARSLSTYEVLTMVATEFELLESPVVDAFLTAIRGVADFDTVARYLYLVEHDLAKIKINIGANADNAVRILTMHHAKGLEFPMVILCDMGEPWWQVGNKAPISLDKNLGICILSADTEQFVKNSTLLRAGIKKKQKQIDLQEKIRLLYVALTRPKEYLYIVGTWKPDAYRLEYSSMLDLINPQNAPLYENLPASPVVETASVNQKTDAVVLHQVGNSEVLVKQSVTALATTEADFADYVAPVKYAEVGGKEFGTAFHKKMQYGELPPILNDLVAGYTVYKEFPFLYLQGQTIVQGIIDLLAVKGQEAIIVDYKTTRVAEDKLVAMYHEQLRLYAQALGDYQVKTYIYSTVHQKLIAVS